MIKQIAIVILLSLLYGQTSPQEAFPEYLSYVYPDIIMVSMGRWIAPETEPPSGQVPNPQDYDWGHRYRIVVAGTHWGHQMFIERIDALDDEGIKKVIKTGTNVDLLEEFYPDDYGRLYIDNIEWIDQYTAELTVRVAPTLTSPNRRKLRVRVTDYIPEKQE